MDIQVSYKTDSAGPVCAAGHSSVNETKDEVWEEGAPVDEEEGKPQAPESWCAALRTSPHTWPGKRVAVPLCRKQVEVPCLGLVSLAVLGSVICAGLGFLLIYYTIILTTPMPRLDVLDLIVSKAWMDQGKLRAEGRLVARVRNPSPREVVLHRPGRQTSLDLFYFPDRQQMVQITRVRVEPWHLSATEQKDVQQALVISLSDMSIFHDNLGMRLAKEAMGIPGSQHFSTFRMKGRLPLVAKVGLVWFPATVVLDCTFERHWVLDNPNQAKVGTTDCANRVVAWW